MEIHPSLKPSVAWVTDLIDRYRFNPFYKTATNVIILQLSLALISIILFLVGIKYVQENTLASITLHIREAILTGATTTDTTLPQSIEEVKDTTFFYAFLGFIALNCIFGFLITRFALWPTRNSLQFQKRFIGNIAHEIRTPLAIIKTNTEVALFDPSLSPSVKGTFEDIVVELDRISETINNLLSFDTLTRPRRMVFESTDLGQIAEAVCERHRALADSRGVAIMLHIGEARMVHGNGIALDQLVTNLTKNAINYTPAHQDGSVTIAVESDSNNKVALTVTDTGIGINQKDLYHIFEPFYRADTSRARGIGTGTSGLGLAIVNEVVRVHRGTITLRSAEGHGTTVKIVFPPYKNMDQELPLLAPSGSPHEATLDFS